MRPRTHAESDVDAPAGQSRMCRQSLAEKSVLPSVLKQHGDLHSFQRFSQIGALPPWVAKVPPADPFAVPGRLPAHQLFSGVGQRKSRQGPLDPAPGGENRKDARQNRLLLLGRDERPFEHRAEQKRPAGVDESAEVVRRARDDRGDQLWRRIHQQRPLGEAEIGIAVGGNAPVEPRLLAHPRDDVGRVVDFPHERFEGSPRSERAPAPDQHDPVTAACEQSTGHRRPKRVRTVGRGYEQRSRRRPLRLQDVRQQLDAVSHRDPRVAGHAVVARRSRQPSVLRPLQVGEPLPKRPILGSLVHLSPPHHTACVATHVSRRLIHDPGPVCRRVCSL
jgi:hypothetical protein